MYAVSQKNVTTLCCYNFDIDKSIWMISGKNITGKVSNQMTTYFPTSPNQCFCTTWGIGHPETRTKISPGHS